MSLDITLSGGKVRYTQTGFDPIYLPPQNTVYAFNSSDVLRLITYFGYDYESPLADLTIGGVAPANQAAALAALALVFPDTNSGSGGSGTVNQTADYVVVTDGTTISAIPRTNSGLDLYSGTDAYTVIQDAINALTPSGATGTGGGKIYLADNSYTLSNELTIAGWTTTTPLYGGGPTSQLTIEGKSTSTQLIQNTSGKNAIVIKNAASVNLSNLFINVGHDAASGILTDKNGATSEIGCYGSTFNNITVISSSITSPGIYLRNPYFSFFDNIQCTTFSYHAMVLENNSASVNYGNSTFGKLILNGNTGTPNAGLKITSTTTTSLCHLVFNLVQIFAGYNGIITDHAFECHFNKVDIEFSVTFPIVLGNATYGLTFGTGFIQSNQSVYTAITTVSNSARNTFKDITITGSSASIIPIADASTGYEPNSYYDIIFDGNDYSANISIANAANTYVSYKLASGAAWTKLPGSVSFQSGYAGTMPVAATIVNSAVSDGISIYNAGGGDGTGAGIRMGYANNTSSQAKITGYYDAGLNAMDIGLETNSGTRIATFRQGSAAIGSTTTPNSTLYVDGSFATKYTTTATGITLNATHQFVKVTATGQTITLPTAVGITGREYIIKLTASGSGTVATTSSQTIDASTTYSLSAQYKYVRVKSDGANWLIIANN